MSNRLDHITSAANGRYSGKLHGAPNFSQRYNRVRMNGDRLLYHSGLDEVLYYPQIPTKTMGFSLDILAKADWTQAKTLTSNVTQQWAQVYGDVVIKEVFEGAITQQKSFFNKVFQFWTTLLGDGEYMMWRPLDLTDKVYRVRIVEVTIGGETMDANFAGTQMPDKWLTQPIEVHMKLVPTLPPSATIYAAGNLE